MNKLDRDYTAAGALGMEVNAPQRPHGSDVVASALNLVSETAAAIKEFEGQAAQALARAHGVADAVKEELARAELRAERAETMLRLAEDQIAQMSQEIERTNRELEALQAELSARATELTASEQRADAAEAAVQTILDVIRARLPAMAHGSGGN
jgi:septal ring factor EnvC (AmiA/AmiB activator)